MNKQKHDENKEAGSDCQERLVRHLRLVGRRMLFLALILPVVLMHLCSWLLVILCEIGWVIMGYVSGRTEHKWLEWTERLLDWMQELGDRVTALNSAAHGGCPATPCSAFRGPMERHRGTIRVRVDVQREGRKYWARVVADPIRPEAMPLASGPTRKIAIRAACEKASILPNVQEHLHRHE
jgi:hypothetical protein